MKISFTERNVDKLINLVHGITVNSSTLASRTAESMEKLVNYVHEAMTAKASTTIQQTTELNTLNITKTKKLPTNR